MIFRGVRKERKVLAVRGICENGRIELLDPVPKDIRSMVAVVFIQTESFEMSETEEAALLAQSPTFKRLVKRGLTDIEQGNTRPVEELLNELSD